MGEESANVLPLKHNKHYLRLSAVEAYSYSLWKKYSALAQTFNYMNLVNTYSVTQKLDNPTKNPYRLNV